MPCTASANGNRVLYYNKSSKLDYEIRFANSDKWQIYIRKSPAVQQMDSGVLILSVKLEKTSAYLVSLHGNLPPALSGQIHGIAKHTVAQMHIQA